MARTNLLKAALLIHIIYLCNGDSVFEKLLDDVSSCANTCKDTYSLHTSDQVNQLSSCERGCRLFTIIEFASDNEDTNATKKHCRESCTEAYKNASEIDGCYLGCQTQQPYSIQRSKEEAQLPPNIHVLYPIFMMQSICNSMMDRLSTRLSSSWTVHIQSDNSNVLIIESDMDFSDPPAEEPESDEYKTSNYLETNIRSLDDSATPDLKYYSLDPSAQRAYDQRASSDWLSCVSKKTGLPRLVLSLTIFVSAMVMIWLCLSSAATAPDQRVRPQKLSLYGDLEVIQSMKEKGLQHVHPQDGAVQFGPLPVKISVQKV